MEIALADRLSGTTNDVSYRYDDAGHPGSGPGQVMMYNSALCTGTADNLLYPDGNGAAAGQGLSAGHPHGPASICGVALSYGLR